ncbi:MAG: response regulator transcription factor [bacterium]|nr:response regulator transcription factor [bacterium]
MNETITAIIVDDEPLGIESLKQALEGFEDIDIIEECHNGFEAVQAVQRLKPHLLFLDIQMPKLDGFDVIELLGNEAPFIIFVTSYDEYALRAFEAEALDYLLKPVQPQRLQKAIQRVREKVQAESFQPFETLIEKHQDSMGPLTRILIRNGYDVVIIPAREVVYIEAQDDYVKVYAKDGKSYLKSERMSRLEKMLDPRSFCRIHRSYILNIDYLKKIEPYSKDSRLAILTNGGKLTISRTGYNRLMELL